jgi:hypothetical protein
MKKQFFIVIFTALSVGMILDGESKVREQEGNQPKQPRAEMGKASDGKASKFFQLHQVTLGEAMQGKTEAAMPGKAEAAALK